jgi:hypothetical protein
VRECVGGRRQRNRPLLNKCGAWAAITNIRIQKVRLAVSALGAKGLLFGL